GRGRTIQDLDAVELGLIGDALDFIQALLDFSIDRVQVIGGVRAVVGLDRQLTNTLQVVIDFVQRTFRRLSDGDAVVGVTGSLRQTADVGREAVGNGLAGSVILGAIDAQARGQALDRRTQGGLGLGQIVLRDQSKVVGVDNSHERLLRDSAKDSPFLPRMTNRVTSCSAPLTEGGEGTLGRSTSFFALGPPWGGLGPFEGGKQPHARRRGRLCPWADHSRSITLSIRVLRSDRGPSTWDRRAYRSPSARALRMSAQSCMRSVREPTKRA